MKNKLLTVFTLFLTLAGTSPFAQDEKTHSVNAPGTAVQSAYGEQLGTVVFPVSCSEAAKGHAEKGLALLHHMTYEGARDAFVAAAEADPGCAMAYWGQAMSFIHPLWSDPPSRSEFEKGKELARKAAGLEGTSDRESAYISAVQAYYDQGWNPGEKENLAAFEKGWREVYERYPDDPEAASFQALALLGTADPADKSYSRQKQAAEIAQKVRARVPDHPGAHHYTIHAYDYPPLAEDALEVARSYGEIAPEVPHALHMPSHIFTRLGLWPESIAMNRRSADAALKHPAGDKISMHYLHALDYLAYAYLQRGEVGKAEEVFSTMKALDEPIQPHAASAYALAAVPARLALERQQWAAAASLEPRVPAGYPWDEFPAMEAITYFARALGAARTGDGQGAGQALDQLAVLRDRAAKTSPYWAKQVEIQRLSGEAWLEYLEGRKEEGLATMREAAELEASTEKHPVTPGEVLPAQELLADLLLETGNYREAQENYLAALERSPNRFNSLFGAGRSAELAGDRTTAALYYRKLVEMAAEDSDQGRLRQAKEFLRGK